MEAPGKLEVVMETGGGITVIVKVAVLLAPVLSVTLKDRDPLPDPEGVPANTPDVWPSVKPAGRVLPEG